MEIPEILKALERFNIEFPREALEEAVQRREEITPDLLRILEYTVENAEQIAEEDTEGSYFAHLYAMYLLAQFRETRAYPLVVQFARLPEKTLDCLSGDFITEGLGEVLASVCDGDTSLIESLIEDPNVDEYARSAALYSLLIMVGAGDKTRNEVMDYFKALYDGRLERSFSAVWNSLNSYATYLYPDEVYDRIVAAYEDGLVEPFYMRIEEVDEVLRVDRQSVLDRFPTKAPVYIQNVIEEMEWWHCFNPPKRSRKTAFLQRKRQDCELLFYDAVFPDRPKQIPMLEPSLNIMTSGSYKSQQAEFPIHHSTTRSVKILPNEPCPCGSNKKYKKCCGRQDIN